MFQSFARTLWRKKNCKFGGPRQQQQLHLKKVVIVFIARELNGGFFHCQSGELRLEAPFNLNFPRLYFSITSRFLKAQIV
jgi:hypothetical protein